MKLFDITYILIVIGFILVSCVSEKKDLRKKEVESNLALNDYEEGERLFDKHCAACHSKKLDEDLTGPKLAHITKRRDIDWLLNFTKYPYEMIKYGDTISNCLFSHWQPVLKGSFLNSYYGLNESSFETETKDIDDTEVDASIINIYKWIAYESERKKLVESEAVCKEGGLKKRETRSGIYAVIYNSGINGLNAFLGEKEKPRLELRIKGQWDSNLSFQFSLIYPERNIAIPFIKCEGKYILLGSQGKKKISLPKNERAFLFGEKLGLGERRYLLKDLKKAKGRINIKESDFLFSYEEIETINLNY